MDYQRLGLEVHVITMTMLALTTAIPKTSSKTAILGTRRAKPTGPLLPRPPATAKLQCNGDGFQRFPIGSYSGTSLFSTDLVSHQQGPRRCKLGPVQRMHQPCAAPFRDARGSSRSNPE